MTLKVLELSIIWYNYLYWGIPPQCKHSYQEDWYVVRKKEAGAPHHHAEERGGVGSSRSNPGRCLDHQRYRQAASPEAGCDARGGREAREVMRVQRYTKEGG